MGVCGRAEKICFRNVMKGDLDFCESAVLGRMISWQWRFGVVVGVVCCFLC